MALDFHLAKSEKEAVKAASIFNFSELIHGLIFRRVKLSESNYPLLYRVKNYYSDAQYDEKEIAILIKEIFEIEIEFIENKSILDELNKLRSICNKAQKEKMKLWVFCD